MFDTRFEASEPFSEAYFCEIEEALGRQLPNSYCELVKKYGGCFVGGLVDDNKSLPILAFFGSDKETGVLANLFFYNDLREDGVLPFAGCELGNIYVLDRENKVFYIDYYGGQTCSQFVSESFSDFLSRIIVEDDGEDKGKKKKL